EMAVISLADYYRTLTLGIIAYFRQANIEPKTKFKIPPTTKEKKTYVIVFGSDQGLVAQFNDSLTSFVSLSLKNIAGKKEVWAVGERVQLLLSDVGLTTTLLFHVPNSVHAITPLVSKILLNCLDKNKSRNEFYIFHNQPKQARGYLPVMQRLLPLDKKWKDKLEIIPWPTKKLPQVAGGMKSTLEALIREYLFVSLFKACAESLSSENASRLNAMQRAEKSIEELLDNLGFEFNRLRQSSIDEELFDVVSGFEMLSKKK
ncbi:MAG: F0F1 ATP synthase subunit gamma, partial [Bacteroidia bacterium]|nr:F0F1 ATP synthase subunit gamma [Bacteroidia bacterium]